METINNTGLGLVIVGAVLSLGRDSWAPLIMKLYTKIKKRQTDERLTKAVAIYLMMMGMIFTIVGILFMFNVIK